MRRASITAATALALVTSLGAGTAVADPGNRTLGWIIAHSTGSDCASGPFHDNLASAANGDTIQMWGCGSLATKDKTADGGGRFIHTTSTGTVEGNWVAVKLMRYQSYGGAEEFAGLTFEGGQATLAVRLTPDSGVEAVDALLEVYCLLGDPPDGVTEGIRLAVRGGPNFNKPVDHGETGFHQ